MKTSRPALIQALNIIVRQILVGAMKLAVVADLLLIPRVALQAAEPKEVNPDKARVPGQIVPKIADALQPVTLRQAELSGEIGRRIDDLIYKNYMVLNLDHDFLEPFRSRPFTNEWHYDGVGKVIDAGSLFAAYT